MTKIPDALKGIRANPSATPSPLAPDGLQWPEGYFDRIPPKQTIEDATAMFGVRPTLYAHGWPCYTTEETMKPEYKGALPDEPEEIQALYRSWADAPESKQ